MNSIDPSGLHCRPWRGGAHAGNHCIPDPVEDFFTETVPVWAYDHRYDIGQGILGVGISLSCTPGPQSVACLPAIAAYGFVTLLKIQDTEGNCQRWIAVLTGGLGAIPGGNSALWKYGGEAIASFSSALNGVGCATPAHASGTPRENKE